jgi:hypothetical protein
MLEVFIYFSKSTNLCLSSVSGTVVVNIGSQLGNFVKTVMEASSSWSIYLKSPNFCDTQFLSER